jgi:putative two-component system response regulator
VLIGARLFDEVQFDFDRQARDVALYHHARWDGTGYPTMADLAKLREETPAAAGAVIEPRGEQIPLFARIVALADVFDALISERSYKKAWTVEDALAAIEAESGRHFDPALAALFPAVVRRRLAQTRHEAA